MMSFSGINSPRGADKTPLKMKREIKIETFICREIRK
jgi:hypothetical protein